MSLSADHTTVKESPNALSRGTLLHGYRIEKVLGGGGFSIVYAATELETRERMVIKEYLPESLARRNRDGQVESLTAETESAYRQGIKRFFNEASALAKVNHPNIVRVTNFFRSHNTVYMVMRYETGKDLRWYIKRSNGGLSEKFIRTVFPLLLVGLRELHDNKLLHLDIKPANIFMRPGGKPLLLDFGAAQAAVAESRKNEPYTLTIGFAPIEQHRAGHIGPWTDLYAIGASMWACISGRAPPPATERVVKDNYKSAVKTYSGQYSQQLLQAIDWCLEMDQTHRPQNVNELLDFLDPDKMVQVAPPGQQSGIALWGFRLPWKRG